MSRLQQRLCPSHVFNAGRHVHCLPQSCRAQVPRADASPGTWCRHQAIWQSSLFERCPKQPATHRVAFRRHLVTPTCSDGRAQQRVMHGERKVHYLRLPLPAHACMYHAGMFPTGFYRRQPHWEASLRLAMVHARNSKQGPALHHQPRSLPTACAPPTTTHQSSVEPCTSVTERVTSAESRSGRVPAYTRFSDLVRRPKYQ